MPVVQRSEFVLALNQVASERGVDPAVVLDTVKNAILAAFRKDHPGAELEEYRAELNPNTGEAHIFHNDEDVTPPGFGRIAAQTAKQVILQKIREKEKEAIMTDYRVKIGSVVNGMVLRFAGPNVIIDIGKTEAIMPQQDQIGNEKYHLNQRLTVYLREIREGLKGEEIIVSRASAGLIEGLFKREVPEVAQGSVIIKAIAREAGNRTKVAVASNQQGIDPVGSCVGQKGVRVQAIIQEFNGMEKIDIIQWSDDPQTYIMQSLSPAKNIKVEINEEEKLAVVTVPKEELSLAIGKEGQNVRIASKLTGYRLEIRGAEEVAEETKETKGTEETPKNASLTLRSPSSPVRSESTEQAKGLKEVEAKEASSVDQTIAQPVPVTAQADDDSAKVKTTKKKVKALKEEPEADKEIAESKEDKAE